MASRGDKLVVWSELWPNKSVIEVLAAYQAGAVIRRKVPSCWRTLGLAVHKGTKQMCWIWQRMAEKFENNGVNRVKCGRTEWIVGLLKRF
jgi:hypothetical protein